jgi:hypothetical protein
MSNNRLVWDGLAELRAQLRSLPRELAGEASDIVTGAADGAKSDIVAAYPERTGNLRDHVIVSKAPAGIYGAGAVVKSTAKHAWMFENGTQARHTALGANRGSMPPGHVFIPAVIRRRRAMYADLKALLVRHGLRVSGDAAA